MAKHSPGPWRLCQASPENGCDCGLIWSITDDVVVAHAILKDDDHYKDRDCYVANARLIAAAPALLEMLQWFIEHTKASGTMVSGRQLAEAIRAEDFIAAHIDTGEGTPPHETETK